MTISYDTLPETIEDITEAFQTNTPENTAMLVLAALCEYVGDKAQGIEMLNFLKGPLKLSSEEIDLLQERLRGADYLPYSYFEGAIPTTRYTPTKPYTLTVRGIAQDQPESGYATLTLQSGGDARPRVLVLRQKDEEWFLWAYGDLLEPIEKPPAHEESPTTLLG